MQDDLFGQPTSLSTAAGIEAWNAAQRGFLAHAAATPERLAQVLLAEPDFALGHAARGLFCLLLGRREMVAAARDSLEAARAAQRRAGAVDEHAEILCRAGGGAGVRRRPCREAEDEGERKDGCLRRAARPSRSTVRPVGSDPPSARTGREWAGDGRNHKTH